MGQKRLSSLMQKSQKKMNCIRLSIPIFTRRQKKQKRKNRSRDKEQQESNDRIEEIILQMAELAPVTVRDLLSVLEITQEEAEKQLSFLCQQGYLIKQKKQAISVIRKQADAYGSKKSKRSEF